MAHRRGNALDFTGLEPGTFPIVPEGHYNIVLSEAYIYQATSGNDVLSLVLDIEDNEEWEGQKLFLSHPLIEKARAFILASLTALGIVEPDDRGPDGKSKLTIDYEVEKGMNFRKKEVDMVTDFVINEKLRSAKNRRAIATVVHRSYDQVDATTGKTVTKIQPSVTQLEGFPEEEGTVKRSRRDKKFGF